MLKPNPNPVFRNRKGTATITDSQEAQASFDGVSLLVQDQYCVDTECSSTRDVDAAWVVQRLRTLMQ